MVTRKMNIAVGLTGLLSLIGLAALLLLFGYVPAAFEPGYDIQVQLNASGGLAPGSRVRMADVDVGRVNEVRMVDPGDPTQGVHVRARIRHEYRIPAGVQVSVKATSPLGGSPVLDLSIADIEPPVTEYLAKDGSGRLTGRGAKGIEESLIAELSMALAPVGEQISQVVARFDELSEEWIHVGRNLRLLTDVRNPEEVDEGQVAGNLASAAQRLDTGLREAAKVIEGINAFVNDPEFRAKVDRIVANMDSASGKFEGAADGVAQLTGRAEKTLENLDAQFERLTTRYYAVADDLSDAVRSASRLIDEAREGEGTIGLLVRDPGLYRNLEDAASRAGEALDELKLLIEKFKEEGLRLR